MKMKKIKSFTIDHTKLKKGLYISRVDRTGLFSYATTFDLRMKTPYVDVPLNPATAHTIEHCLATYLRNRMSDVLYVGPMGCMTGFYVILKGRKKASYLLPFLLEAFDWIIKTNTVPGATKKECGNYLFMNLSDARKEASAYMDFLLTEYVSNIAASL